jgi:hypothetical protein
MNPQTLFLAWQDKNRTRGWFPVGRLDSDRAHSAYRFRYTAGADIAQREAGFPPLLDFPDLHQDYRSKELFPMFKNRVIMPGRPDFADYLARLDLEGEPDPIEMLAIDGGFRATDSFEVFPKIETLEDGSFRCRFFLHGWRHVNPEAQQRLNRLVTGEPLYLSLELTNPATGTAIQIQTEDYHMIGWAPRYLLKDLMAVMSQTPRQYAAFVVRVNPVPAPSKQRVLIELGGHLPAGYQPMSSQEFEPLVL